MTSAESQIVANLRFRWKKELEAYTDKHVLETYNDFSMSVDFGNNDEKFAIWIEYMEDDKVVS